MTAQAYDTRLCELGEGSLWHAERNQLFWFDILNHKLRSRDGDAPLEWLFDRPVSAAARVDRETLMVAGAGALMRFDIGSGRYETVCGLETDKPGNRSNDGRADPWGGFWISTVGRKGEKEAGSIWRYFRGEMRRLHERLTTPNAICFDRERGLAHFSDTSLHKVWRQKVGRNGWPEGEPELFLDLSGEGLKPDGGIIDAQGSLWVAHWGDGSVGRYSRQGERQEIVRLPVTQPSCPAFGGPALDTLFITTAQEGLSEEDLRATPQAGAVFMATPASGATGVAEPAVEL